MKRKSAVLLAAAGAGGLALAGGAAALRTQRYLRNEYARPDAAAGDDFSALDDATHHRIPTYDGGELHVMERGPVSSPPLLLIHGVTLSSLVWRYQLRDLAGPFRVLALDQRGHGQSTVGRDGFGLDRLGRDVLAVLEALDLHDAVLVGHSMGGFAVQKFCIDHPDAARERVAGIVLLHTACAKLLPVPKQVLPVVRRAANRVTPPRNTSDDAAYLGARFSHGRHALPSQVRLTYQLSSETDVETSVESVLAFLDMDLRAGLRDVKIPALVIGGSHDRLLPPRHAQLLASSLPNARLEILGGCGHMGMLERHETVDRLIAAFAAEVGVGGDGVTV